MDTFFQFFFSFVTEILMGFRDIFVGIWNGLRRLFNIPKYIDIFKTYSEDFSTAEFVAAIIAVIVVIAIFCLLLFMLIMLFRKYFRFRKSIVGQEDLLEELAGLQNQVLKLIDEKDKIMAMKVSQIGGDLSLAGPVSDMGREAAVTQETDLVEPALASGAEQKDVGLTTAPVAKETKGEVNFDGKTRFVRLREVDKKYMSYTRPEYNEQITLPEICEMFRNYACSQMGLYYEIKIIRLFLAGMASTKLLLLQGISGTGKTSLPYSFGKFLENDATVASVQPSWRDRTELFGYFNEFTKKFNETEVLRRMYEASYNDDVNVIILDEMNIARVEYYFAEMLSVLEMPNPEEWELELVPSVWENDPLHLEDGRLKIPQNMWYIGTANNDDSTFAVSDKVYDRAQPINLDAKGVPFEAPETPPLHLSYSHLRSLFNDAIAKYPVSEENLIKIGNLDIYVIEKMRLAFGNRIMKQLKDFVPVYVACGGTELDGIDYILVTKVFRKFESLNLAFIRDEISGLITFMDKSFGKNQMLESKAYLKRLQKLY